MQEPGNLDHFEYEVSHIKGTRGPYNELLEPLCRSSSMDSCETFFSKPEGQRSPGLVVRVEGQGEFRGLGLRV